MVVLHVEGGKNWRWSLLMSFAGRDFEEG